MDIPELVAAFLHAIKHQDHAELSRVTAEFAQQVQKMDDTINDDAVRQFAANADFQSVYNLFLLIKYSLRHTQVNDLGDVHKHTIRAKHVAFMNEFHQKYIATRYHDDVGNLDIPDVSEFTGMRQSLHEETAQADKKAMHIYKPHQLTTPDPYRPQNVTAGDFFSGKVYLAGKMLGWGNYTNRKYLVRQEVVNDAIILKRKADSDRLHQGEHMYIITETGSLYADIPFRDQFNPQNDLFPISDDGFNGRPGLYHSNFRSGQPIGCAGYFTVNDGGKIVAINAASKDFKPPITMEQFITGIIHLYNQKYIADDCMVDFSDVLNGGRTLQYSNGKPITKISIGDLKTLPDLKYNPANPQLDQFRQTPVFKNAQHNTSPGKSNH